MTELVTEEELIRSIRGHLPQLLRSDPSLGDYILSVTREHFSTKVKTEDRFTRMLNELARDREAQSRKLEEQNRKWEESTRRFDETNRRIDRSIGALGSRWGIQSERAFRDALAGILVGSFGVEVLNVNEFDDEGEVFGRPDQVGLDVIIKNGLLILCELKSSMSKLDMHTFERKVRFYERRHPRQANRMIVVSPMIDDLAHRAGEQFGIEMYPDSLDVPASE